MKKLLFVCIFILSSAFFLNADSSGAANKNTALRCLKLAENCLVAGDWQNALSQAELGLSYDDSVSDLYYIQAAAKLHLGDTRAQALRMINLAFEKDSWAGYTKNGARILLADLLSDTGHYEESLKVLDSEPFLYSSDAEFIRIKDYYRIASKESLSMARTRLNSDRRVYPSDSRFPEIFFLFESMFLNEAEHNGVEYQIPAIVQTIAESYIAKLPDYTDKNPEMELLAVNFARKDDKNRLIKAIDAKNKNLNALLAITALRAGIYTDSQAYDMFFSSIGEEVSLDMLETFVSLLSDNEVINKTAEVLGDFTGTLYIDENMDLQYELTLTYEKGRPQYVKYDNNNDGEIELYSSCDFGAPVFVYFNAGNVQFFYDSFPRVSKITYTDNSLSFNFIHDDMTFTPFEFALDNVFARAGVEFYIPYIAKEIDLPLPKELYKLASSFELPVSERENARVVYTLSGGNPVFADFYEQNQKYAYCDFSKENTIIRYVDFDNDGVFETSEIYAAVPEGQDGLRNSENSRIITSVFNFLDNEADIYLRKIQIDRNENTFSEFSEEYLEYNGKITIWDNDDNGLPDCQYIRYPQKSGEALTEETLYFDSNGLQILSLLTSDGVPVKMNSKGQEVMISAGINENLYWIEEKGDADAEDAVIKFASNGIVQGSISLIDYKESRVSVIKVGPNLFCRFVPVIELPLDQEGVAE